MPAKKITYRDSVFSKKILGYDPRERDCVICSTSGLVPFAPGRGNPAHEPLNYGICLCVNPFHVVVMGSEHVVLARGWEKKSQFSEVENPLPVLMR